MKISREARSLARELFDLTLVDGRLDAGRVAEVSDAILRKKPRFHLQILKEFTRRVRLEVSKHRAQIQSAVPLAPDSRDKVHALLKTRFGADLDAHFESNPELIAGLKIQVGSDVWDGSVQGRLQALKQQL